MNYVLYSTIALLLQVLSDLPFIPQIPQNTQMNNPLMHMISQMQQVRQLLSKYTNTFIKTIHIKKDFFYF